MHEKIASHTLNCYLTTALIELQQKYNQQGDTWQNASLAGNRQCKLKQALEKLYKAVIY